MPSPKLVPLVLSDGERDALEALVRRRTASQALALRARIVLACAGEGGVAPLTRVAAATGVSREMVRKWRARFAEQRLDGLADAPRPGAPRKVTDEQVEVVVTRVLSEKGPGQDSHWSTRAMAGETGLSQSTVSRIWRAFGLKPHLVETWKLSADPEFIAKVRDVVGLYMNPPEHALVLAVDEKSQIQALDRTAPCLPVLPTTPARMTRDYVRHGTTSLFAAYDVDSGSVIARPYRRHRHQEFLRFLKLIDSAVPKDLDLHLVLDNYATHKTPAIHQWLLKHPRFHLHFTPTSSSWLNLVERWFAELTSRKLRRSAHRSVTELEDDIRKWINEWNKDPKPFTWTKSADDILETLAAYCQRCRPGTLERDRPTGECLVYDLLGCQFGLAEDEAADCGVRDVHPKKEQVVVGVRVGGTV
jgi:transposase